MNTTKLHQRGLISLVGIILFLLLASVAQAQPYAIDNAISGNGGGTSSNSQYTLSGTIAQPASDSASSSGYGLATGFWSAVIPLNKPDAPLLTITKTGEYIVLSWSASAGIFNLEETTDLNTPITWIVSKAIIEIENDTVTATVLNNGGLRFFRLSQTK